MLRCAKNRNGLMKQSTSVLSDGAPPALGLHVSGLWRVRGMRNLLFFDRTSACNC